MTYFTYCSSIWHKCLKSDSEELRLQGQEFDLTIAGTGGTKVETRVGRVELTVANLDSTFSSPLQAHVLIDIAGDTPAIRWSEVKQKWPHLHTAVKRKNDVTSGFRCLKLF